MAFTVAQVGGREHRSRRPGTVPRRASRRGGRPPRRRPARTEPWAPTSSAGCSGWSCCCSSISFLTFVIFYMLPSADPAPLRAGRAADAGARRARSAQHARARQAVVRAVLDVHEAPRLPLRLRLQLPEQRLGQGRRSSTGCPATIYAGASAALIVWLLVGIPIGIISAVKRGTWMDRAAMGVALVAISAPVYWLGLVSLYLFSEGHRQVPDLRGLRAPTRRTATSSPIPVEVIPSLILPWFVLAAVVRGDLRALPARQPDRDDGRGLHPHGAGQGPARAPRHLAATACARRSRRSSRSSASTSASCSAARSSPRPSSTSPASAGWPTTRSRRATCRRPGHGAARRVLHHLPEPDRGHRLRLPRPARAVLADGRCSRSRTSRSTSRPRTASSRPSTASPTRSSAGRRSASSASPARARASRR